MSSSIHIKVNDKPRLAIPKMVCDNELHPKLNQYDVCKFLNCHQTSLLIGKPKSGKTSLLFSLFKSPKCLREVFHNIFLFQPTASGMSIQDNIFDQIPDEQRYDELTEDNLTEVVDLIKEEDKKYNNCIIFDDMTAYLKDNDIARKLKEVIFNRRHYRTSIFFLVQSYMSVPLQIRKTFNNLFVFKVSKMELRTIFDELVEREKELVDHLARIVFDEPHQYLFINTDTQRLFRGFDEILIEED